VSTDRALLLEAVRGAGAVALRYFRKDAVQWEKEPGDPVSEADHAVNDHLEAALRGARPDYGWLSEESEDDKGRLAARRVWVVDPIDGTRAFLKDRPEFSVAVGLLEDGVPVLAAVFNPATEEYFEAERGGGARLNGATLAVADRAPSAPLHLLASRRAFEHRGWLTDLPDCDFTDVNSIAYRMALVAAGRFDATVSISAKSDWDIAAAALIAEEAGAFATDGQGAPFRFNQTSVQHPSVLVAAPAVHASLLPLTRRI
jgi:myo-inositol-1(or 4)-monophosphatase